MFYYSLCVNYISSLLLAPAARPSTEGGVSSKCQGTGEPATTHINREDQHVQTTEIRTDSGSKSNKYRRTKKKVAISLVYNLFDNPVIIEEEPVTTTCNNVNRRQPNPAHAYDAGRQKIRERRTGEERKIR